MSTAIVTTSNANTNAITEYSQAVAVAGAVGNDYAAASYALKFARPAERDHSTLTHDTLVALDCLRRCRALPPGSAKPLRRTLPEPCDVLIVWLKPTVELLAGHRFFSALIQPLVRLHVTIGKRQCSRAVVGGSGEIDEFPLVSIHEAVPSIVDGVLVLVDEDPVLCRWRLVEVRQFVGGLES